MCIKSEDCLILISQTNAKSAANQIEALDAEYILIITVVSAEESVLNAFSKRTLCGHKTYQ